MAVVAGIRGLEELWAETSGVPEVCIAVLDGPVDRDHPVFGNRSFDFPAGVTPPVANDGLMSMHGTHVSSIIFGQHDSEVHGVAPGCRALLVPVFADGARITQVDLARGIERAVQSGAHVINISGGQLTECAVAEDWLDNAVQLAKKHNVLIVAAAGNNGCECLHVPAALPHVLAVGALGDDGEPLDFSNWGEAYGDQGVLAPGENILGATPGGGTMEQSGTSFAAPIVSGVAGLLLSMQFKREGRIDPARVREVLLQTVNPCDATGERDCTRFLAGTINITGAKEAMSTESAATACGCQKNETVSNSAVEQILAAIRAGQMPSNVTDVKPAVSSEPAVVPSSVAPPVATPPAEGLVYALGTLGYDFGTEARRDSFKQMMPPVDVNGITVPPNPYDARQMVDYLLDNPSEARSLIWTLSLELTPIYVIEPSGAFAADVYNGLRQLLAAQVMSEVEDDYVERVSVPGVLTGANARLLSGQSVPVIKQENLRGLYGWRVNSLVEAAVKAIQYGASNKIAVEDTRRSLRGFLSRVYFDLRNLGSTSHDRALNFAATNAFQAATTFGDAVARGMELDEITVEQSPYCRPDSDCWDVKLKFFDPENNQRAKQVYRFTIDVSDTVPVTMGEVRAWSSAD